MTIISNVNKYDITPAADEANQNRGLRGVLHPEDPSLCAGVANHTR